MHNYCTLFDSYYLSRGIAMYNSLLKNSGDFHLYIFAFDDLTFEILNRLELNKVSVISLTEFETSELLNAKKSRSKAEYCWTCTPSVISYVFEKFKTPDCTYIDYDLFFYGDPSVLISEMEQNCKNVLITEHRYSLLPRLYEEKRSGRFCVQFMTFKNETSSLEILENWRNQCIDWCYARHEDGKFGDQKYLDVWPEKYYNIHILEHEGGGVAPWNLSLYKFYNVSDELEMRKGKAKARYKLIFYHFQYLKYLGSGTYDIGWYFIPGKLKSFLYFPYIRIIENIEKELMEMEPEYTRFTANRETMYSTSLVKRIFKNFLGYNIINKSKYGLSD